MNEAVVRVEAPSRAYEVVVGREILTERIGAAASSATGTERAVVITDDGVPGRWNEAIARGLKSEGLEVLAPAFPQGEASKTLDTAHSLLVEMARAGVHRGDLVVGVGGGVVTDLAGLVASVYMRGVRLVQVPTTLLGMVDAAIGGKTGVNLEGWKNLVGTFYQPHAVIVDVATLETLPDAEVRTGLAEVVKYGFISNREILVAARRLAAGVGEDRRRLWGSETIDLVHACVEVKASVVSGDETESGPRAILNFGHTLGHALERATSNAMSHGEAVSIGMTFEAELSRLEGMQDLRDEVAETLSSVGLPTSAKGIRRVDVLEAMALDKKYSRGLHFVLLESIGNPVVRRVDDSSKIDAALCSVGIE